MQNLVLKLKLWLEKSIMSIMHYGKRQIVRLKNISLDEEHLQYIMNCETTSVMWDKFLSVPIRTEFGHKCDISTYSLNSISTQFKGS